MTTALLETLTSTELPLAQHSQLIGAVLEGQEGASATVKVNGVAATYPVTLTESDTLRIERPVGEVVTRLYGQPGPNAGTGPKGDTGPAGTAATVTIGTVTTGAAGTQAQVTNSGTASAAVLNFTIPKGADGTGGSGAVSSVNSKAGDVTLTAADVGAAPASHATDTSNPHAVTKTQVGLGNVTNDAQVKRSEMGVASGVATLGPDGKVPAAQLPAGTGGTLDTEAVQDIVGAMVRAGDNVTVNYDDAANTLTIGASAGGAGAVSLSNAITLTPVQMSGVLGSGGAIDYAAYMQITPSADFAFGGVEDALQEPDVTLALYVWREATKELLWAGSGVTKSGGVHRAIMPNSLMLRAGTAYLVGWVRKAGSGLVNTGAANVTYTGFTLGDVRYSSSAAYPTQIYTAGRPTMTLMEMKGRTKTVTGPLDPIDFPISTTAAAPNKSGFMVVNDAAKTASLYWKFSDGTTKKLDLT